MAEGLAGLCCGFFSALNYGTRKFDTGLLERDLQNGKHLRHFQNVGKEQTDIEQFKKEIYSTMS